VRQKIKVGRVRGRSRSGEKIFFSRASFCGNDAWLTRNWSNNRIEVKKNRPEVEKRFLVSPTKLVGFICPTKKVGFILSRPRVRSKKKYPTKKVGLKKSY
jgi:hypothetical protein